MTIRELLQYCMSHYVALDTKIKLDGEDIGFVGFDPQTNELIVATDRPEDWNE